MESATVSASPGRARPWLEALSRARSSSPLIIAVLFFGYAWVHPHVGLWTALPEAAYYSHTVTRWALELDRSFALLIIGTIVFGAVFWRRLRWQEFDHARGLRVLVFATCAVVTWAYAFNDVDVFFDQPHRLDRLLLIALCGLVLVHPAFAPLVLFVALPLVQGLGIPLGYFSWTDKRLPLDLLLLFSLFLAIKPLLRVRTEHFLFVWLVLLASNYFTAGRGKLELGTSPFSWWWHDDLGNLFVASWENGWLHNLHEGTVTDIASVVNAISPLLLTHTMLVEVVGALLILWHRRIAMAMLALAVLMHIGIVLASGIFFWKWIVVDAALLYLLWRWPREGDEDRVLFRARYAALATIAVIAMPHLIPQAERIPTLAWYDTGLNQYYRFEVVTDTGETKIVPREYFAPLDIIFAQNRFHYLNHERVAIGTYGSTGDWDQARWLAAHRSPDEVLRYIDTTGAVGYDPPFVAKFDEYMRRFFTRQGDKEILLSRLGPPSHIQSSGEEPSYDGEPVRELRVRFIERYFDGSRIHDLRDRVVHTVQIP